MGILLTSGYNFEGYRIKKYLGFCSGECALGTGFLSSLGAGIADILGSNSTAYKEKLAKAKSMAISELEKSARSLGANAIIGLDADYTTFTSDIMGVIVSGTAVMIEKIDADEKLPFSKSVSSGMEGQKENTTLYFPVINFYPDLPFRLFHTAYDINTKEIQIFIYSYHGELHAMNVDIIANTIFGTCYEYTDVNFIDCSFDAGVIKTEKVLLNIPYNQFKVIQSISVKINCYILDGKTYSLEDGFKISPLPLKSLLEFRDLYGEDVECDFNENAIQWSCMCGHENAENISTCACCGRGKNIYTKVKSTGMINLRNLLPELSELKNCEEIYQYLRNMEEKQECHFPEAVMEKLKGLIKTERMYGNMKREGMLFLETYILENE